MQLWLLYVDSPLRRDATTGRTIFSLAENDSAAVSLESEYKTPG